MGDSSIRIGGVWDRAAAIVLGIALLASGILLFHYRLKIGLVTDDLIFLKDRGLGGVDTLLKPHSEHIVILQAALYRINFVIFGIATAVPLQAISLATFLLSVVAFVIWTRQRVGEWTAVIAAIPLLFLGTAYYDLLWAFQIGYSLSILGGLIALLSLEKGGRHNQPVACLALCVAVTSSSLGLPFLVGVAVALIFRDRWSFWRSYVLIVPALIFIGWYAGWGHTAYSFLSISNVLDAPAYLLKSMHSVVLGLTGLHRLPTAGDPLGWVVLALIAGLSGVHLYRRRSIPRPLLIAAAIGLTFWLLSAFNQLPGSDLRGPDQSRYQFPGAVFFLMILAGVFDGVRPGRRINLPLAGLAAISVACSLGLFSSHWREFANGADQPKAQMTAVDIAGDRVRRSYEIQLIPYVPGAGMDMERYRELTDAYGPGGWDEGQISSLSQVRKTMIVGSLADALALKLTPAASAAGDCRSVRLRGPDPTEVSVLRHGQVSFNPRQAKLQVLLGRFGSGPVKNVGAIEPGSAATLRIPRDRSSAPWQVAVTGRGLVRVCTAA